MVERAAPLGSARTGERWVIRHRLADASATDAVGWIERLEPDRVVLVEVGGRRHEVLRSQIVLARRAPAALGGPHPRRVPAQTLESLALPGWLAEHEALGEWTLRAGGGFTGRANSCLAVGDPGRPVAEAARRIIAYAAAHAIAPMAQVVTGSAEEAALVGLGWVATYEPTDVLVAPLAALLADRAPDPAVEIGDRLDDRWRTAYGRSRPNRADPGVLDLILGGPPPVALAARAGSDPDVLVAIGRGSLNADWLGLASSWTDPAHRRRGLATAVLVTLGHWAARRGARYAYLQVAVANRVAHTAYERLGFVHHHAYGYLRPPEETG